MAGLLEAIVEIGVLAAPALEGIAGEAGEDGGAEFGEACLADEAADEGGSLLAEGGVLWELAGAGGREVAGGGGSCGFRGVGAGGILHAGRMHPRFLGFGTLARLSPTLARLEPSGADLSP